MLFRSVRAHYGRPSFEDSADQLHSFFNALHQSALIRTRSQAIIPVQLIDEKTSSHSVPTGQCVSSDDNGPDLADGFTPLAPLPPCLRAKTLRRACFAFITGFTLTRMIFVGCCP